jgi:Hemerythrin HHE cation binding domain
VDIYGLLTADHAHLETLFARLEEAEDPHQRDKLFQEIRLELLRHKEAEERTFYAALRQLPEIGARIEEAIEEHADIAELIVELDGLDSDEDDFAAQLDELHEEIEHHVEEEEGETFAQARQLLSEAQAKKLAKEFLAEKARLST